MVTSGIKTLKIEPKWLQVKSSIFDHIYYMVLSTKQRKCDNVDALKHEGHQAHTRCDAPAGGCRQRRGGEGVGAVDEEVVKVWVMLTKRQ